MAVTVLLHQKNPKPFAEPGLNPNATQHTYKGTIIKYLI